MYTCYYMTIYAYILFMSPVFNQERHIYIMVIVAEIQYFSKHGERESFKKENGSQTTHICLKLAKPKLVILDGGDVTVQNINIPK